MKKKNKELDRLEETAPGRGNSTLLKRAGDLIVPIVLQIFGNDVTHE